MQSEESNPPSQKANGNTPILRPHVFDGIQEFDQKLPNWWLFTLYIAIAFSLVFWFWTFQISIPLSKHQDDFERVAEEVAAIKEVQRKNIEKVVATLDDQKLWEMSVNKDIVARGQATFDTICFTCHGKDLSGTLSGVKLPGLPLNDEEWKHGGKPMQVYQIVAKGSPDIKAGMIAWEPQFGAAKIAEAVAYILSVHTKGPDGATAIPK